MTSSTTSSPPASPSSKVQIQLKPDERWYFVGKTGSGKTTLAKHFLTFKAKKKPVVIVADDLWLGRGKDKLTWSTSGLGTIARPRLVRRFNPKFRVQCIEPDSPGWEDANLLAMFAAVLKHGNITVYIDELFGVVDQHHNPIEFKELWSKGRKYGVEAWGGSQRPSELPDLVMSQAENWAVFRVINPKDLNKVADMTGSPQVRRNRLKPFWWYYWSQTHDEAQLMRPIPLGGA